MFVPDFHDYPIPLQQQLLALLLPLLHFTSWYLPTTLPRLQRATPLSQAMPSNASTPDSNDGGGMDHETNEDEDVITPLASSIEAISFLRGNNRLFLCGKPSVTSAEVLWY